MDSKQFIVTIVSVLAVLVLILSVIGVMYSSSIKNRERDLKMNSICVEAGFSGWRSTIGCIGGSGNND